MEIWGWNHPKGKVPYRAKESVWKRRGDKIKSWSIKCGKKDV